MKQREDEKLLQYAQLLGKVLVSIVMLEVENTNFSINNRVIENFDILCFRGGNLMRHPPNN